MRRVWNEEDLEPIRFGNTGGKIRNATFKDSGSIMVRSTWCFRAKEYYYGVTVAVSNLGRRLQSWCPNTHDHIMLLDLD